MSCPYQDVCPFAAETDQAGASFDRVWKIFYCEPANGYRRCARFLKYAAGEEVPVSLFPNARQGLSAPKEKELPEEPPKPAWSA